LNIRGSIVLAEAAKNLLSRRFGLATRRFGGVNVFPNGVLASTGAVASGTAATGFVPGATGGGVSSSAVVERFGKIWQVTNVLSTGVGTGRIDVTLDFASMDIASGQTFGLELEWFIESTDGVANLPPLGAVFMRMTLTTAGGTAQIDGISAVANANIGSPLVRGRCAFPIITLPVDPATLTTRIVRFQVSCPAAGTAFRLGVGSVVVVRSPSVLA
jgi:hypothetical protein